VTDDYKRKVFDNSLSPFERLELVMEILRSENGCAWDRKQTHKSLLPYLIEETYEVAEAIEKEDFDHLKEELGDLACQIAFHAQLAKEAGHFEASDSINSIIDKLIRRHPHVFENKKDLTPDQVRDQWEKIKVSSGEKKSVLSGIPKSMPALVMAFRIGEKAAGVGFDWDNAKDVVDKIDEELAELKVEIDNNDKEKISDEIGDLMFSISSLARKYEINPEIALKDSLNKFKTRFELLEKQIFQSGKTFDDYTLEQLEEIWQKVK
jgi:tetrapyrrole methylase family protein/MazG family protein